MSEAPMMKRLIAGVSAAALMAGQAWAGPPQAITPPGVSGNDSRITGALQSGSNLLDIQNAVIARTNLGLGTMATQGAGAVAITGGTASGLALSSPSLSGTSTYAASSVLSFGSGSTVTGGTLTSTVSPSLVTPLGNGGSQAPTSAVTLSRLLSYMNSSATFGSVGGATDDTTAFQKAANGLYRSWGTVTVPASSSGYTITTPSSLPGWTIGSAAINWNFVGGTPVPTNLPGAIEHSYIGADTYLNGTAAASARNAVMQHRMYVSHIPANQNYWWDGYHVEAFLDDDSVASPVYGTQDTNYATTQREARAYSCNMGTNSVGTVNGEIRCFKGITYAIGGNANLRSVYGYSTAVPGNNFTGQLTGTLSTIVPNGEPVTEAVGSRSYVGPGSSAAFQAAGAVGVTDAVSTFTASITSGSNQLTASSFTGDYSYLAPGLLVTCPGALSAVLISSQNSGTTNKAGVYTLASNATGTISGVSCTATISQNTAQYGFMMRPAANQPLVAWGSQYMGWGGSGDMATAAGVSGAVGDFLTEFQSNTNSSYSSAVFRVDQKGNTLTQSLTLPKLSAAPSTAPGAGKVQLFAVAGTTGGTCKLQVIAGTSTTPTTLLDNIGSGC